MIANQILQAVATCFYVFYLLLLIRCLLTFFPWIDWKNPLLRSLRDGVDIYLNLFRRFLPPIGPFDLSPILAFFALGIIQWVVIFVLRVFFSLIGI